MEEVKKVSFTEERVKIATYPEADREDLPMFAENRVHQRTSGNPFPNKVVLEAQRELKTEREYTLLKLENEFLEIAVLPDLGGKIWYAKNKKTGYCFIYKNHVVKPALIGVLGSWTSGGMEFNWPFHHRASTFMPVDYSVEEESDAITIWMSENDPMERMKGMVGICLRTGECIFETKVKLDNLSDVRRSFLWWENTAVPVNENYEIFFPEDVNYVNFHYKRSVTPFPLANSRQFGAFNGIYYQGDVDISKHKNTRAATSYFSAQSEYDYFGGYDHGKDEGIVHVADHHLSPGKKMFTWGYGQLSKTWENALTDNDGAYAELMAGCYSDNQPDFSWIYPNETKIFSQKWYPIHGCGIPVYANEDVALFSGDCLILQSMRFIKNAEVTIRRKDGRAECGRFDIPCYDNFHLPFCPLDIGERIVVAAGGITLADYERRGRADRKIPAPRKEYPYFKKIKSASELYKLALHCEQYRSPDYSAEDCYIECLKRDRFFVPALVSLAEINYRKYKFSDALAYINRAESIATEYNARLESGRLYYTKGLILSAVGEENRACDYFHKAAYAYDYKCSAMLKIGLADIKRKDYRAAVRHLRAASEENCNSVLAPVVSAYSKYLSGERQTAVKELKKCLEKDRLNIFARFFLARIKREYEAFILSIRTDMTQTILDICGCLFECGLTEEMEELLETVKKYKKLYAMPEYLLSYLRKENKLREFPEEGIAFPSRIFEMKVLQWVCEVAPRDFTAHYLLGILFYGKGNYAEGMRLFREANDIRKDYRALRNLAVGCYSHERNISLAKKYMREAVSLAPKDNKQILFEYAYFLAKTNQDPQKIVDLIEERNIWRDEIAVELARAYNHLGKPDKALEVLLSRKFVACEGGEHYIADQYMFAHYLKGREYFLRGDYLSAIDEFEAAAILPQSLGSGLWNDVKKVPYLYFQAMAYDRLGRRKKAEEILRSYLFYRPDDYFTNMYLYTYCYYAARAYEYLGEKEKGDALMENTLSADLKELTKKDMGHFDTTPFFISFIDDPAQKRKIYFAYRLYLTYCYLNQTEKAEKFKKIYEKDGYGMYITDFTK